MILGGIFPIPCPTSICHWHFQCLYRLSYSSIDFWKKKKKKNFTTHILIIFQSSFKIAIKTERQGVRAHSPKFYVFPISIVKQSRDSSSPFASFTLYVWVCMYVYIHTCSCVNIIVCLHIFFLLFHDHVLHHYQCAWLISR